MGGSSFEGRPFFPLYHLHVILLVTIDCLVVKHIAQKYSKVWALCARTFGQWLPKARSLVAHGLIPQCPKLDPSVLTAC